MLFLLFSLCLAAKATPRGPVIATQYGPVQGVLESSFVHYTGVPFAKPPVGALRFKAPQPPSPWTEPIFHDNFTIACASNGDSLDTPKNKSEDCLYLELYTPRPERPCMQSKTCGVALWFYGGDFKEGGESFGIYNGKHMAALYDTILVVCNYRLDVLGFLYVDGVVDANAGILDQRFALAWTHTNIGAFGGDSEKIMIFGQSAGGQSVLIHMSSPKSKTASMIGSAIAESGPISLTYKTKIAASGLAGAFGYWLNCDVYNLTCLQEASLKRVLNASRHSWIVPLDVADAIQQWAPVMLGDDEFPEQPIDAFRAGRIVKRPFVAGSVRDDGRLFAFAIPGEKKGDTGVKPLPGWEYMAIVLGMFHDDWVPAVLARYPPNAADSKVQLSHLITDYLFKCSARRAVALAAASVDAYWYDFMRRPDFCVWPKRQHYCCYYACHGTEIVYWAFDTGAPFPWGNLSSTDASIARATCGYWSSVASTGAPNAFNAASGGIEWPRFTSLASAPSSLIINWPLKAAANASADVCDFFDRVGYVHAVDPPPPTGAYSHDAFVAYTHSVRRSRFERLARLQKAGKIKVDF